MASKQGKVVPIFINNKAHMENLRKILDQPGIRDLPLVVIPVAGEYRTGKSFLLSYLLRYLRDKDFGDKDEPLDGLFDHKKSAEPVTQGISTWNQPIIVEVPKDDGSKKEILVLLMDSQGLLCAKDNVQSLCVFALTTMISSHMIFNIMNQLNDGVLGHLELFTALANTGKVDENKLAEDHGKVDDNNKSPFQKMMILIRDWVNDEEFDFGIAGGEKYMLNYFKDRNNFLNKQFSDVESFLMPTPGSCVRKKGYNGSSKDLETEFVEQMEALVHHLLDPRLLEQNLKTLSGKPITAKRFCDYFEECAKQLANVDWKDSTNILKAFMNINCETATKDALKIYDDEMKEKIESTKDEKELHGFDKDARDRANKEFEEKCALISKNDPELYTEVMNNLNQDLEEHFEIHKNNFRAHKAVIKLTCNTVGENALSSYEGEMKPIIKTTKNEKELQTSNDKAKDKAIKKYEDEVSCYKVYHLDLINEGLDKLKEEWQKKFKIDLATFKSDKKIEKLERKLAEDQEELIKVREDKEAFEKQVEKMKETQREIAEEREYKNWLQTIASTIIDGAIDLFKMYIQFTK